MDCPNLEKDYGITTSLVLDATKIGGQYLDNTIENIIKGLMRCDHFKNAIFKNVRLNGGNREDAEDVIISGLTKLAEKLNSGDYLGVGKIEDYAYSIVYNNWRNWLKKKIHNPIDLGFNDDLISESGNIYVPAQANEFTAFEDQEYVDFFTDISEKLSKGCKQPLMLFFKGYSYKEISVILNKSDAALKVKVSECRKRLREYIKTNPEFGELHSKIQKNRNG